MKNNKLFLKKLNRYQLTILIFSIPMIALLVFIISRPKKAFADHGTVTCNVRKGPASCSYSDNTHTWCNTSCANGWIQMDPQDGYECQEAQCSCGNTPITCCRPKSTPTPTPIQFCKTKCVSTDECSSGCLAYDCPGGQPDYCTDAHWCNWCQTTTSPTPTPTPPPPPPTPTEIPPTPTPTVIFITPTPDPVGGNNSSQQVTPPPQAAPGYVWICLKSNPYNGAIGSDKGYVDHKLRLTGILKDAVKQTYIIGCIETNFGLKCKSGDPNIDNSLRLNPLQEHQFKLLNPQENPITLNSYQITEDNNVIVYSKTQNVYTHTFYSVYSIDNNNLIVSEKTPQLAQPSFSEGTKSTCIMIMWDPRGQVLEYPSLKPLKGVQLLLTLPSGEIPKLPTLKNPLISDNKGKFDFVVTEGKYKIKVNLPADYKIIENPSKKILKSLPKKSIIYKSDFIIDTKKYKDYEIIILVKKKNILEKFLEKLFLK